VFTGLGAGSYRVLVSDDWSCRNFSNTILIKEPTIVQASLVVSKSLSCTGSASLILSATGGTGQYSYSATPNFALTLGTFAVTSLAIDAPPGTYRYYVKDANGCTGIVSNDISIDPLVPLTIKLDVTNPFINCRGDNTGVIVAIANGGLGNYVYTLLDDATNNPIVGAIQTTPGYFTNLAAGSYKVGVVSRDCNTTRTITIKQPDLPLIAPFAVTPVTCNGNNDGKIVINASGGTGVIKFAISPNLNKFFETGVFDNLKPGNYDVIVQDVLGCYIPFNFTVTEPSPIFAVTDPNSILQELCAGEKTGAFSISINGGVAPYTTSLDDPKGTYAPNQVLFAGLTGGNHTVYVRDANLCELELVVSLDPSVVLDPIATSTYDCVNDLPANIVTVTIDDSNNSADVLYSLDSSSNTQGSNIFVNVAPGDHFIMAHHKNGCIEASSVFNVKQIDPLAISIDLEGLNEIVATVTGGSGVYHYTVNGEDIGSNNKYIYYKTGNYTVTVTDSNGCVAVLTKYFEFIDIKIPSIFTPNGSGTNDNWQPTNTENYPLIHFVVYDRYGRIVGTFGAGQFWDGNYNGTELPMGDYWYVLKLRNTKDDREFVGHFTLYR
jgi:gliding motility-associated-like protein